jgi:hypothetical protein
MFSTQEFVFKKKFPLRGAIVAHCLSNGAVAAKPLQIKIGYTVALLANSK